MSLRERLAPKREKMPLGKKVKETDFQKLAVIVVVPEDRSAAWSIGSSII